MNWFTNLFEKKSLVTPPSTRERIFLDYASATPLASEAKNVMEKYFSDEFYNPNAIYDEGVTVKDEVERCRKQIAQTFGAAPENVIFTSGGTEANTWVIRGVKEGNVVIEENSHPSVIDAVVSNASKETTLISSVTTDNKLGRSVQEERRKNKSEFPLLHIDASQTVQYFNITLESLSCDIITIDAAKFYGPKGVGAIILRRGVKLNLPPLGTPAVPLIVGMSKALEIALKDREAEFKRLRILGEQFGKSVEKTLKEADVNYVLPNIINVSIPGILPEYLVLALDRVGVLVSAGPACNSNKPEPPETPVRISLGRLTTENELKKAAEIFCRTVQNVLN